jgi:hypothetical protein
MRSDAVADGDNAFLGFLKATSYDVICVKYTYGTGWGSEETVEASCLSGVMQPVLTIKSTNKIRFFYTKDASTIKYRDRDNDSWQGDVTISSSESSANYGMTSCYKAYWSKFCVIWRAQAASPYDVRFEGYTLGGAVLKEVVDSFSLGDGVLRGKTLAVSDVVGLADVPLKGWSPQISDSVACLDAALMDKSFSVFDAVGLCELVTVVTEAIRQVTDGVSLSDGVGLDRALLVADEVGLADNVYVGKVLAVSDGVVLVEVVEKSVQGVVKTRVFLVLGDLAVQLTGD